MNLKNQRGQFLIEAVLLMTILMGCTLLAIRTFRENQILATLVQGPWEKTSGMIEGGVWGSPAQIRNKIPYTYDRFYTPKVTPQ